jgi:predicted permease
MPWAKIRSLTRSIIHRQRVEREMSDELRFHLERRAEDLMARHALSRDEAFRHARIEFGSVERYKEEGRQARGLRLLDELRGDLRFAARTFRKNPAFSLAAIATLALGIGANTAVFSAIDTVLFKDLPVKNPAELVAFNWVYTPNAMLGPYSGSGRRDPVTNQQTRMSFSYRTFEKFQAQSRTLSDVFAFDEMTTLNVVADNQAEVASRQLVTGGYFAGFGVPAALGRTILPADDDPDASPVAVLSYPYWQRRFRGAPEVLGKSININGQSFAVIGVTAPEFLGTRIGEVPDLFIPMRLQSRIDRDQTIAPWEWWIQIMGRLKPGVTPPQVLADVKGSFEASVREAWDVRPANYRAPRFQSRNQVPELNVIRGGRGPLGPERDVADMLPLFWGIVAMVLLIVCANLTNLFLARASTRLQEISVRRAIGAGRWRLIRQLLTESVLLALGGGAAGVVLAYWGKDFLSWLPASSLLIFDPQLDIRVLLFTATLAFLTGLVFGIGPAVRATRVDLSPTMRLSPQKGGSRSLVRKSLLVAQVSISLIMLVGTGLFIDTVRNLQKVDAGYNTDNLLLFDIDISPRQIANDQGQILQLHERIVENLANIPGVVSTTMSGIRPLSGGAFVESVSVDGVPESSERREVYIHTVRFNFFETMGMPVIAGRSLSATDNQAVPKVAVINETMAKRIFSGADAIGKRFHFAPTPDSGSFEVVGIVRDAKYSGLREPAPPTVYLALAQRVQRRVTLEVRTAAAPLALMTAVRRAVHLVEPDLPLSRIKTQTDQIAEIMGVENTLAFFSGLFSTIALMLASIGLYGIVSYSVSRRTNEIGVRMALGAQQRDIVWFVMREILSVMIAGLGLGVSGSVVLARLISSGSFAPAEYIRKMLYGVGPYNLPSILFALVVLVAVAAIAGYLPARRASRVDPVTAVRLL